MGRGLLARVGFASGSMPEQRLISCGYVLLRFAAPIEGAAKRLQVCLACAPRDALPETRNQKSPASPKRTAGDNF